MPFISLLLIVEFEIILNKLFNEFKCVALLFKPKCPMTALLNATPISFLRRFDSSSKSFKMIR